MRNAIRIAITAAALAVPVLATAQVPISGFPAFSDCTNLADNDALNGELYAVKVTNSPAALRNDMLFDVRQKGEGQSDTGTNITPNNWAIDANWRAVQGANDVHFIVITYDNGQIALDGGDISSASFDAQALQTFGTAFVTGGLSLPGTRGSYNVDLGPSTAPFPRGTTNVAGGTSLTGINIAFPPLAEGPIEIVPGSGCYVGSALGDPLDTTANGGPNGTTPVRGPIIGYNVYRIPDGGGAPPTAANFMTALNDGNNATGFQYFMDIRTFRLAAADTSPGGPGTAGGSETTAVADLSGLQNPDAQAYSGDEVLIFQDADTVLRPRCAGCGTVPTTGQAYWYAVQPVMTGRVSDFTNVGWTGNGNQTGDHRMDLNGDTVMDAVSLDSIAGSHNTPEFISPQAGLTPAQDGLGLTHAGVLFLSRPMHFDPAVTLPVTGQVQLTATVSGNDVNIQFTTGLEAGNVTGYNVYRMNGAEAVRVNDQPILAQGNEANVYTLVERTSDIRRLARGSSSIDYKVEIVYADGTTRMVGPFTASLAPAPARRRR
jgi:hypothetical protein